MPNDLEKLSLRRWQRKGFWSTATIVLSTALVACGSRQASNLPSVVIKDIPSQADAQATVTQEPTQVDLQDPTLSPLVTQALLDIAATSTPLPISVPTLFYNEQDNIDLPEVDDAQEKVGDAYLDLTHYWDDNVYEFSPVHGKAKLSVSLFVEKGSEFNYGFMKKGMIPGDVSTLQWNSMLTIKRFGMQTMRPGDEIVFMDIINPFGELKEGESGELFFGVGRGMCNAATALSEAFGMEVKLPNGEYVPLFIARPGAIQPHNFDHNPKYYQKIYHGPGVAVNLTEEGTLPFMLNPNLPQGVEIDLSLNYEDTKPDERYGGVYKSIVSVDVRGLPQGYSLRYQRLTANRSRIVGNITGSLEFWSKKSDSVFFDNDGNPILSSTTIVSPVQFFPDRVVNLDGTFAAREIFESLLETSKPPENLTNPLIYPDGFARRGVVQADGTMSWLREDGWLQIHPLDLPTPIREPSAAEYFRILSWNNVGDPENMRYKPAGTNTKCNVAAYDWATAYKLEGFPYSAPLPRWLNDTKLDANAFYDFFASNEASLLGWQEIDAHQAQAIANEGFLTFATVKNWTGSSGHITAVAPGGGETIDGVFYPNTADGGWNWGPELHKTVLDSFRQTMNTNYSPLKYYVWIPPVE